LVLYPQHCPFICRGSEETEIEVRAVQYSAGSPLSFGMIALMLFAPVTGMFIQCFGIVP